LDWPYTAHREPVHRSSPRLLVGPSRGVCRKTTTRSPSDHGGGALKHRGARQRESQTPSNYVPPYAKFRSSSSARIRDHYRTRFRALARAFSRPLVDLIGCPQAERRVPRRPRSVIGHDRLVGLQRARKTTAALHNPGCSWDLNPPASCGALYVDVVAVGSPERVSWQRRCSTPSP
jgi:hypothetical protein